MESDPQILVKYRMEQAEEALAAAQLCIENHSFRATINRAYYAMFYAVLALLSHKRIKTSKHGGAIAMFDREFVKNGSFDKKYSVWLHDLFQQRQETDYEEMIQVTHEEAFQAIALARSFFEQAKNHITEQTA